MPKQGEIQLVISAVTDQANKELEKLTKQYNKLAKEQEQLTEGTVEFGQKSKEIDKVRNEMEKLSKQIESGTLTSYQRLSNAEKAAERELKKLTEGTEDYIRTAQKLESVRIQKNKVKDSIGEIGKEMEKGKSRFASFSEGASSAVSGLLPLAPAAIGALAVDKIVQFAGDAIAAFDAAAKSSAKLHQSLVVNGGESEEVFQRLIEQSNALEEASNGMFNSAQIQDAQAQLKILGLYGNEIEFLLPKIADAASANGMDLAQAVDTVGAAMRGEMDAIQNWGITLDKDNLSLDAISTGLDKFAGSTEVAANIGTNSFGKFSVMMTNAKEATGEFLLNAGDKLLEWLTPIGEGVAELWRTMVTWYELIVSIVKPISNWIDVLAKTYPWLGKVKEAIVLWATPLGLVGKAIKETISAFSYLVAGVIATVATIREQWDSLGERTVQVFSSIGTFIKDAITNPLNISESIDKFKKNFGEAGKGLGDSFAKNYNEALGKIKGTTPVEGNNAPANKPENRIFGSGAEDKAKKEAEKALKEQEKAQKEAEKSRETYNKSTLEAEKILIEQRIAAMQDGLDKEIAIIEEKKRVEIAAIAAKENEIKQNEAISAAEKADILAQYEQIRLGIVEKYGSEEAKTRLKYTKEALKNVKDLNEISTKDFVAANNGKLTAEQQLANRMMALATETTENQISEIEKRIAAEEKAKEKEIAFRQEVKNAALDTLQTALGALGQFSQYAAEKQISDAEKVKTERLRKLDTEKAKGRISEEKYAKEKEAIELDAQKRISKYKHDQAVKEKQLAIVQSLINTALAITAALTKDPTGVLAAFAGVTGAIQTAVIAAKPIPEFSKGGGIAVGASHSQGGISLIDNGSGQKVGEMEGGEMYHIYSKETTKNNGWIMEQLLYNSMHKNGAPIFAGGGVLATAPVTSIPRSAASTPSYNNVDVSPVVAQLIILTEEVRTQKTKLEAYITYSTLQDTFEEVDKIKTAANRA
jgi:hypothetical protein